MASNPLNLKSSFPPVSDPETEVLILGTLPGDRSLHAGEYFAHPRNRFWKVMAAIACQPLPLYYSEKLELLRRSRIGLWNVLDRAERRGSLDSAIRNEVHNDLPAFIASHRNLKLIAFDGLKPEAFYDKYFERNSELTYIPLPSCSPANARFDLQTLCERWSSIMKR